MSDNVFQFNWRGMTREPSYPYAQPQDGSAQARAAYIAKQSADMQGYRPLPNMSGYQPTISGRNVSPDSNPLTQPEIASMQGEAEYRQLEDKLAANEQRIEELKQEYMVLQQEQETATEDLERNVAANRAGIGDTSQYNAWRARVDAREARNQAREADSDATLRQAKAKVDRAFSDIGWARGERQTELAKAAYKDAVDEYNEVARKLGKPEISESELVNKDTVTMFDTKDFIRQHRNSKGLWDSEENQKKAYEMAKSLGDEGIPLLDEIYGQITTGEAAKKQADYGAKVQAEVDKIDYDNVADGDTVTIPIDGKSISCTIKTLSDGTTVAVVNGKNYKLKRK
jgi:TolA-binding protein